MRNLFILLFAITSQYMVIAQQPQQTPISGEEIPLTTTTIKKPRTIVDVVVQAFNMHDSVTILFNEHHSDADIVVTNTTTGESWYDSVNGVGATSIALSGDEGYYEIYIYTDCGDYTGTFII